MAGHTDRDHATATTRPTRSREIARDHATPRGMGTISVTHSSSDFFGSDSLARSTARRSCSARSFSCDSLCMFTRQNNNRGAAAARRALSPAIHYVCLPAKTTTGAPQLLGALFLLRFIMYVYPPPAKTTTTGSKCSPIARRARQPRDSLCMFTIMTDTVYVSPVARRAHQLLSARAVSAHPPSDAPPSKSE